MQRSEQKGISKKLLGGISLGLVIVIIVFLILFLKGNKNNNQLLGKAIKNTNSLKQFHATIQGTNKTISDGVSDSITTTGTLRMKDAFKIAMYELHTVGEFERNTDNNFDITALFFTDGKKVYESVGTQVKASEIELKEFQKICKEIHLYEFDNKDVKDEEVTIAENPKEASTMMFNLKKPNNEVLDAHAKQYSTITGKKVPKKDVEITMAKAIYMVKDEYVFSQELETKTSVTIEDIKYEYHTITRINYLDYEKTFDFELPKTPK